MKAGCLEPSDFRTGTPKRVFHSGDLGDIIYSLLFCSSLGRVELAIGPDSRWQCREAMSKPKFEWLAPLLRRQPWISSVEYTNAPPEALDYNLNEFRLSWFSKANAHRKDKRLFECYFEHFNLPKPAENSAWIDADPAVDTAHPVVISRTHRWRNDLFPWKQVSSTYSGRMIFVGLHAEYLDWTRRFGKTAEFREVVDALDLANIIAGAKLFIGNQSLPMALALALNVPVIQESCVIQHDCVFHRDNAQFTHHSPVVNLPAIGVAQLRPVVTHATRAGIIELGPFNGAPGIGDTLMITPLARALGDRAIMTLPPSMERLAFLFRNLCRVRISDSHPIFTFQGGILQSAGLLRMFRMPMVDPIPRIDLDPANIAIARRSIESFNNPLAFCPTCSRHWAYMRQRPPIFWRPIIAELKKRYTVLQFGLPDYPIVDGATRMPFDSIERMAACYHLIGNYVGVNTGDHHLMIAVGGRAVVAEADPFREANCWSYNAPTRIQYGKLSHPATVMDAIRRLGL